MNKRTTTFFSIVVILLASCIIKPAPSNTNMGKQRVIVIQVCDPSFESRPAEIAFYTPNIQGPGQAIKPPHRTKSNQSLFESYHTHARAFGVRLINDNPVQTSKYYIYRIRTTLSSEWSGWMAPEQIEPSFPKEVNYRLSKNTLDSASIQTIPKLRYRLERYKEFYFANTNDVNRYSEVPSCD